MAPPVARFAGQGEGPQPSGSIVPFIHVKSSAPGGSLNLSEVVEGLSRDFAETTGVAIEHVTVTWELVPAGQYAVAGKVARQQPVRAVMPSAMAISTWPRPSRINVPAARSVNVMCRSRRSSVARSAW